MADQLNNFKVALNEANIRRAIMADQLMQANASLNAATDGGPQEGGHLVVIDVNIGIDKSQHVYYYSV